MRTMIILLLVGIATQSYAQDAMEKVVFAEPVELQGYASGIAVQWKTLQEQDVDYFTILRQRDGALNAIATMEPRGYPDSTTRYRYIDNSEFSHDLSYILRVVYLDGSFSESDPLIASTAHSRRTRILSALDAESLARLRISLDSDQDQQVVLRIKTLKGETLDTYHRELQAGVNEVEIDYSGWPAGYYSVELNDSSAKLQWLVHVDPSVPRASTRRVPSRT